MEAILILAHGSREKKTEQSFELLVNQVRGLTDRVIETAFMEFSPHTISAGLDRLAARGAKRVKVIPYFLFSGIHIKKDIPEELAAYQSKNPDLEVILEDVIGTDPVLVDILANRIRS